MHNTLDPSESLWRTSAAQTMNMQTAAEEEEEEEEEEEGGG